MDLPSGLPSGSFTNTADRIGDNRGIRKTDESNGPSESGLSTWVRELQLTGELDNKRAEEVSRAPTVCSIGQLTKWEPTPQHPESL